MKIKKASGEMEEYSSDKFCKSLEEAGVPGPVVDRTCEKVEKELEPGTSTEELFERAREVLMKENPILAGKYSLKQAIMDMGPAGYHFEGYFTAILKEHGYETEGSQQMQGKCIEHEIDGKATDGEEHFIIEAKYHNKRGIKSDTQDILYTHERFRDIKERREEERNEEFDHKSWFATNTKVTSMGLNYAHCRNMKVTGWDCCSANSKTLEDLIEEKVLYPTTLLPAVNKFARKAFAKEGIYFAKDLVHLSKEDFIEKFDIYADIAEDIYNQAQKLVDES